MAGTTKRPRFSDADILAALKDTNNVRRYAARSLGISESLLGSRLSKMQKAGITVPRSGWRPQKGGAREAKGAARRPSVLRLLLPGSSRPSPAPRIRSPLSGRLADILAFNSKLAGHPLVDPAEQQQQRQAERRRIAIHKGLVADPRRWWTFRRRRKPRPECSAKRSQSISINSFLAARSSGSSRWACGRCTSRGARSLRWSMV